MGTHLRVLSESYPMNTNMTGFLWFSKDFAFLYLGQNIQRVKQANGLPSWPYRANSDPYFPYVHLHRAKITKTTCAQIGAGALHIFKIHNRWEDCYIQEAENSTASLQWSVYSLTMVLICWLKNGVGTYHMAVQYHLHSFHHWNGVQSSVTTHMITCNFQVLCYCVSEYCSFLRVTEAYCITGLLSRHINLAIIAYSKCPLNVCFSYIWPWV